MKDATMTTAQRTFPRMKVARDPEATGSHPYHDSRLIVSEDWDPDPEWPVGHWYASLSDSEHQPQLSRLFAAAPELLAACKALVADYDASSQGFAPNPFHKHEAALRAAIAKAEGKDGGQ